MLYFQCHFRGAGTGDRKGDLHFESHVPRQLFRSINRLFGAFKRSKTTADALKRWFFAPVGVFRAPTPCSCSLRLFHAALDLAQRLGPVVFCSRRL